MVRAPQAAAIGRRMERDPAGNLWAVPDAPTARGGRPARTSTPCARGGRFDGALGVAAAFAVRRATRRSR